MANWPIVRSQRTMPGGTGIRSNLDFNTNEAMIAQALGEGAKAFKNLHLKQVEDQYSAAEIQSMELDADYAKELNEEQDETKYDDMLEKHIAAKKKLRPKNSTAAKLWDRYMAKDAINLKRNNEEAKHDRLKSKYEISRDKLKQERKIPELKRKIEKGIGLGYEKDEAEAWKYFRVAEHLAEREKMESMAGDNPELFMKNVNSPETMKKYYPKSIPADFAYVHGLAKAALSEEIAEKGRLTLKQTATIKKAATDDTITAEFMGKKISQSDMLTPEQQITAMKLYAESRRVMAAGGSNAYTTTENESLYTEHRRRAATKTITEQEIIDNVGPGGYSWPRAEKLISVINGKSSSAKAFEESAAAKDLKAVIEVELDPKDDAELHRFATNKYSGILEDAIQNNDWTNSEMKMQALRVGRQFDQDYSDGTLEQELEDTLLDKPEIFSKLKSGKFIKPGKKGITKAEFDKLPSGAIFLAPDGKRRRKP